MMIDDFLKGAMDCSFGVEHVGGKGQTYDNGYAWWYQREQQLGAGNAN